MLRILASFAGSLALAGCLANNNSDAPLVILQNTALTSTATDCTFTGLVGQPVLAHGEISTLTTQPYLLVPLIQSRITAMAGQESQRTILIQGAEVKLTVPTATVTSSTGTSTPVTITLSGSDAAFQTLASGSIGPNMATANIPIALISPVTIHNILTMANPGASDHFSAEVVAEVKLFGSLGGDRVESVPFQYGVTVCNDCIVNIVGACPVTIQPRLGDKCNLFQDLPVDCCLEADNSLTCPARTGV